jgi:2-iminobutanoate/2-iminopropanoate deaminase
VRDGVLVPGGAGAETTQAIVNLGALLAAHGAGLEDVVKTTVFMTDMENYGVVNEAYAAAFAGHWPARSAIAVLGLPMGSAVEIEAWAYRPVGPPL